VTSSSLDVTFMKNSLSLDLPSSIVVRPTSIRVGQTAL
jgi:hypothetical protein